RTAPTNKSIVAELESIGANHLGFTKSLFQHYCQHLRLNHNQISAESAFNFYINEKIAYLLGIPVNTKSARETFYHKLIQNTSLPTNYNFASIITKINKEIEHYTQQRYPITYAGKGKEKLQTPAVTLQWIQPPIWKKHRIESPTNLSYHYTPGSAINITATDASTSHATSIFGQFPFQSKQRKEDLLGLYGTYFKDLSYNLQCHQDFDLCYCNQISEPRPLQSLQLPQQPLPQSQQQLQQPLQPNLDPITYAPIAKLEKFTSEEDNAQDTVNLWYQSLVNKPQDFNAFKIEFLRYFSNNNSINRLANTFTTIKQGENEAVTTYLGCFHRNLHQIQAIDTNYFTVVQILNQFICRLCSSILQCVCPMHPVDLQAAVTNARDFEAAELEANYAQAVNLMMNRSFDLNSKLKQFITPINIFQSAIIARDMYLPLLCTISTDLSANNVTTNISTTHILTSSLSTTTTSKISTTAATNNLSNTHSPNTAIKPSSNDIRKSQIKSQLKLEISNGYPSTNPNLLVTSENAVSNNPKYNQNKLLASNIPPAASTEDKSLAAIFPFDFDEITPISLFSGAVLNTKPIMAMYTDAKVDGQPIKLILDTLVGNNWLSKTNATLNWTTQELQISQNGQHIMPLALLIELEEEKKKPNWKAYQVFWADKDDHNELPPILF
ncbi:hypothetical protein G9A89_001544, partial [Geosiphon pyriformis]